MSAAHHHVPGSSSDDAMAVTVAAGDAALADSWQRVVVPPELKTRLLNHALLSIELRARGVAGVRLPMHGLSILVGPAGVGKTTLARGLGSAVARALDGRYGPVRVVDVNVHVLSSEFLGRTQRNIVRLFEEELPALAQEGPLIVVLDEIEGVGVSRSQLSLEINPADVFRGTAAFLTALDWVGREMPGIVAVGTTNVPHALDDAVLSRADLVLDVPLPGVPVIEEILVDTVGALAERYPACGSLLEGGALAGVAARLAGLDGRRVRKFVVDTLARSEETALDPGLLTVEALVQAAESLREFPEGAGNGNGPLPVPLEASRGR